ncbi:DoxX family protein [Streptomyces sp. HNM0574]|uniref:DoxX family protein n=1 Tax=Streptomyces sp. HNM0574 TaxID=2714954 RepID=UPI00146AABDF|nr:DoxX family protein [Streptomyces sp. HNM0574]NLU69290.1 DoxX family protein [Streptomyces sp. HNM0574]
MPDAVNSPVPAAPFTRATQPYALAAYRVVIGGLFACHGFSSLFGVPGSPHGTAPQLVWPGWYAAVIQLVCGGLVLLGLGTRGAAFLASGSMAYAYFVGHQSEGLWPLQNGGEPAALFCWAFFLLIFTGAGALSVDRLISRGRGGEEYGAPADGRHRSRPRDGHPVRA